MDTVPPPTEPLPPFAGPRPGKAGPGGAGHQVAVDADGLIGNVDTPAVVALRRPIGTTDFKSLL